MAEYELIPREVVAHQLTFENWKQLADLVEGVFQQHALVERGHLTSVETSGILHWGTGAAAQRITIGDYIVDEGSGQWQGWNQQVFEAAFQRIWA